MSRRFTQAGLPQPPAFDRREAARLLRAARAALGAGRFQEASDATGWALSILPSSRQALRLKIDLLIRLAHHDAAEALIAVSLLRHPDDASLRLQRAQMLFIRRRLDAAAAAAGAALATRPRSRRALLLSAEIRATLSDHHAAAELLRQARLLRPHDQSILTRLADALLYAGQANEADTIIEQLAAPDPLLRARVRRAQRRYADASATLAQALAAEGATDPCGDLWMAELIAIADETGDWPRLERLLESNPGLGPASGAAAAAALVSLGRAEAALPRARAAAEHAGTRALALHTQLAAAVSDHNDPAVHSTFNGLAQSQTHIDAALMGRLLLRGRLGRLTRDHIQAGRWRFAAADPSTSVLQPMLREAIAIFERRGAGDLTQCDARELKHCRALCLMAMGRTWEAMSVNSAGDRSRNEQQQRAAAQVTAPEGDPTINPPGAVYRRAA